MVSLLLVAALQVTPVTVAVPRFSGSGELTEAKRDFFVDYFSERLSALGDVRVTTSSQIAAVLGAERQRELLGCGESSCSAELAGALGAEALIIGNVAKVGEEFAIALKVIDAQTSIVVASASGRVRREEALLDFLAASASQLHATLLLKRRGVATAASPGPGLGLRFWVPVVGGLVSAIAAGVLFGLSRGALDRLRGGDPALTSREAAVQVSREGGLMQLLSAVFVGVSLASFGTAGVMALVGRPRQETP